MKPKRLQLFIALSAMGVSIVCCLLLPGGVDALAAVVLVLLAFSGCYGLSYAFRYRRASRPIRALLARGMQAAAAGDTEKTLEYLQALQETRDEPDSMEADDAAFRYSRAERAALKLIPGDFLLACRLVCAACEGDCPQTAEAVLHHIGYRRAALLREEQGEPVIPRRYAKTHSFLREADNTSV